MPIYTYECQSCGEKTEHWCKIADKPLSLVCSVCNGCMGQLIDCPMVFCDSIADVSWLPEAARTVSMEHKIGVKPIESRTQFNQYIKEKGLRPADKGTNLSEV